MNSKFLQKTALWLLTKSFSLKDASSFERAFEEWRLRTKGNRMVGWISACANTWGIYFAKTKFRMYQNTDRGKIELPDHEFMQLMHHPNDYQVGWEQKYLIALFWILYGKAFILKLRNAQGRPGKLVLLKPWRVEIVGSKNSYLDAFHYDTGTEIVKLDKEDVIYLKIPSPDSFVEGRPVIDGFLDTQAVDELQMAYQKKFLDEGGFAGRTFVAKQEMGEATFQRIYEQLKQQYGGKENAFKVALLELVEPVKAAYSIKDMDIVRQRMLTRDEILGGMQVPKILLGIGESVNRQTAETAVWQFASGIIDPYMDYIEEVLTLHVQQDYNDVSLQIIHDKVAPRDQDSAISNEIKLIQNGLMTLNEGRDANNLPRYNFDVADKPLFAVGGAIVNIQDNQTIGSSQKADNQLQMNYDFISKSSIMEVQSILFSVEQWTKEEAIKWLSRHDYHHNKYDLTEQYHRFRQRDPEDFIPGSFRTDDWGHGIKAIVGKLKETKSTSLNLDIIWKQFDRRHVRTADKTQRGLKHFFELQKDRLIKYLTSKAVQGDLEDFYFSEEELKLLEQFLEQEYLRALKDGFELGNNQLGSQNSHSFFNVNNQFVSLVLDSVNAHAYNIQKTTLQDIRDFIGEEINIMSNAELSRIIQLKYKEIAKIRIDKIVNTTITAGLNAGLLHAAQIAGINRKMWLTERDSRVRNRKDYSHLEADGQWVDITEPFLVSGEKLLFPGDPAASAGNAINCRCTMGFAKN